MSFKMPEQYRLLIGKLKTEPETMGGAFSFPMSNNRTLYVIATIEPVYEHVSAHIINKNGSPSTPSWDTMCFVKDKFWDDEDTVIQFHPAKSEYVNWHQHTLHLWRPIDFKLPE